MQYLDELRGKIARYFDPAGKIADEDEQLVSPSQRYRCAVSLYRQAGAEWNWQVARAVISLGATGAEIARITCEDDRFWHCWLERPDGDYLICSEALTGQTVVDLRSGTVASYAVSDDEFIWTDRQPAPGQRRLAVIGCYWACPYELRVYDCAQPLSLPLPAIQTVALLANNEAFGGWIDDHSLRLVGGDGAARIIAI